MTLLLARITERRRRRQIRRVARLLLELDSVRGPRRPDAGLRISAR
jgi:hypothetical protein